MADHLIRDLADCTEFRQTLLARIPTGAHVVLPLVSILLGTAVVWAALTEANLVVRAPGSFRPVTSPYQVFVDFDGDMVGSNPIAITEVKYKQGDRVKKAEVLIRMDTRRLDREIRTRVVTIREGKKALARMDAQEKSLDDLFESTKAETRAELCKAIAEFEREVARQKIRIDAARAALKLAHKKYDRTANLVSRSATPTEILEEATAQLAKAESELADAQLPVVDQRETFRKRLDRQKKEYQVKQQELEEKRGNTRREVAVAQSEQRKLKEELERAVVRAPIDGVVTSREPKVGDVPKRGEPVLEIAEEQGFLFEAEVPNEDVGLLKVAMAVRVKVNAFDYQQYGTLNGTVCFISPDSTVAQGRATFLVKIRLEGDEVGHGELRGRIKFGMAGQAEIVTGHESLLSLLVRRIRQAVSLG